MHRQKKGLWQKLPPERRYLLLAVVAALAVHGVLLVLFRPLPVTSTASNSKLATVGRIELDAPSSEAMARWMQNHDPAAMTAPDQQIGYSQVLNNFRQRKELEDLPLPLHLNVPRQLELAKLPEKITERSNLLANLPSKNAVGAVPATGGLTVFKNGWPNRELQEYFVDIFDVGTMRKFVSGSRCELSVSVLPPRFESQDMRLSLQRSSGIGELDKLALHSLRILLMQKPQWCSGIKEVSFIWTAEAGTAGRRL